MTIDDMQDDRQLNELRSNIVAQNPMQAEFLATSLLDVEPHELRDLGSYINFSQSLGLEITYLAECYDLIVKDTLREQMYFLRHGKYRYSSFEEVAESVYFDDGYMRKYMHGLALTAYLWPNHRALHRYFLEKLPTDQKGRYLEIGPGHGMYMMSAMRKCTYEHFDGIDISPTSVEMTRSLLGSGNFGTFDNYRIFEQDFLAGEIPAESYDAIVMGEVLEHVEKPNVFLDAIRRIATRDAFIFITTPINAPAIDHIYLFDSWNSINELVIAANLTVREKLLVPYPGLSVKDSLEQSLPINVAMILEKC